MSTEPAWRRETPVEKRLLATAVVLVAVALQLLLPARLSLKPVWLLPVLELVALAVTIAGQLRAAADVRWPRYAALVSVGVLTVANTASAVLLAVHLVDGRAGDDAAGLLASGASIYLTNVLAFGLWYWELDRGGPHGRASGTRKYPDFLFAQMTTPDVVRPDWEATFVDYLYLSFTNATAFSPTDTLPLARWAKSLMALQSAVALATVALVVARAVNVLPGS